MATNVYQSGSDLILIDETGKGVKVKPFNALSAVITTTTAVAIKAGTASKRLFIGGLRAVNKTTAEFPVILVASDNGTPVEHAYLVPGDIDQLGGDTQVFDPPITVASGDGITGEATAATTGDTYVQAWGWLEA